MLLGKQKTKKEELKKLKDKLAVETKKLNKLKATEKKAFNEVQKKEREIREITKDIECFRFKSIKLEAGDFIIVKTNSYGRTLYINHLDRIDEDGKMNMTNISFRIHDEELFMRGSKPAIYKDIASFILSFNLQDNENEMKIMKTSKEVKEFLKNYINFLESRGEIDDDISVLFDLFED